MGLGRAYAIALAGMDGHVVEVEADVGTGLPGLHLVGLPDAALQEARNRVRAAVDNSGERWPRGKIVLALSPAMLPKSGSLFDVALAAAILHADARLPDTAVASTVLLGELALDGRLRSARGMLPAVLAARAAGYRRVVVPVSALGEVCAVGGVEIRGAHDLTELLAGLRGQTVLPRPGSPASAPAHAGPDLADVVGQAQARQAVEIAAAGGHHLMLLGSPGVGKTMLAQRLPGLLPPLTDDQSLEVSAVHSLAGRLGPDLPRITRAPFVAPHHTATAVALVGGGQGWARPGAVSLAHRGVLFLDECPELSADALEALRTPLEEGVVRLARSNGVVRYPARCQLVLAANPCPCAPARDVDCVCPPAVRRRYLARLSGPLLDRVDLHVSMHPPAAGALTADRPESSAAVAERVGQARDRAAHRWSRVSLAVNAEIPGPVLRREYTLSGPARRPLETALRTGRITARGVDRTLRVAWSLADLADLPAPGVDEVAAALMFRAGRAS